MHKLEITKIAAFEVRDDEQLFFDQISKELDIEITYFPEKLDLQNIELCKGFNAVTILGFSRMDAVVLEQLKEMGISAVATRSVGYNHIDIQTAKKLGIKVSNATYAPNGVADYTIMLMLMLLRKYKQAMFRANVNDYSLTGLRGKEMKDLTIGIVGTGSIGEQVIKNLTGFGCKILAYNRTIKESVKAHAEYVSLEQLYAESDMISYHLPLTDATKQMVNAETIKTMKDGVILVNCSRGELMNISDIIEGIESEKLGALGLDVFVNESGIYHVDHRNSIIRNRDMAYIRQFPNVIMTHHIAFYTNEAVKSMVTTAVECLVSVIKTGDCKNAVN